MGSKAVFHFAAQATLLLFLVGGVLLSISPSRLHRLSTRQRGNRSPIQGNDKPYDLILRFDPHATPMSPVIPRDFVSLSFEWNAAAELAKSPVFRNLISNLLQHPMDRSSNVQARKPLGINFRVGGNSADRSRWDESPHSPRNSMTPDALKALYKVAENVGGTLTLDLNMQAAGEPFPTPRVDTTWAMEEWRGILQTLSIHPDFKTIVEAIEIGNEPDLFPDHGYRPTNYSLQDYAREYGAYLHDLELHNTTKIVQGGTFCCREPFVQSQAALMYVFRKYLKSWSFHKYATTTCRHKTTSIAALLDEASTTKIGTYIRGSVAAATALGIPATMGETNSASCGGQTGVSDTLASALWSIDYLFVLATHHISRVNFHGGGTGPYTWFVIPDKYYGENATALHGNRVQVRPLYYGMFLWNWLVANHTQSRVFPVECRGGDFCVRNLLDTDSHDSNNEDTNINADIRVKVWAMGDTDTGDYKVVILNKLYNSSTTKDPSPLWVKLIAPFPEGHIVALKSSLVEGMEATTNLTIAGWTWEGSYDGERNGKYEGTTIYPKGYGDSNGNTFELLVPPATAMVVWFRELNHPSMDISSTS